ncbi:MAG TPA: hypothetical protein VL283_01170 [Candidatus Baltobacteraceae bacterium]|nr:hypothetical protein [Candidatus Baltobacteraceae bacterium]
MQAGPKRPRARTSESIPQPRLPAKSGRFVAPVIPGRSIIPGQEELTFPAFFRAQVEPVTFREVRYEVPRETIEEIYLLFAVTTRAEGHSMLVLVPRHVVGRFEEAPFWYGYTVVEHDDELFSFQCVVFRSAEAVPKGGCDQGGLYEVPVEHLSAWDGQTQEQSRAGAA